MDGGVVQRRSMVLLSLTPHNGKQTKDWYLGDNSIMPEYFFKLEFERKYHGAVHAKDGTTMARAISMVWYYVWRDHPRSISEWSSKVHQEMMNDANNVSIPVP